MKLYRIESGGRNLYAVGRTADEVKAWYHVKEVEDVSNKYLSEEFLFKSLSLGLTPDEHMVAITLMTYGIQAIQDL